MLEIEPCDFLKIFLNPFEPHFQINLSLIDYRFIVWVFEESRVDLKTPRAELSECIYQRK